MFFLGGALALVGLVLLVVETVRALTGNTLATVETILLWGGVGLVAVGGLLLVLSVSPLDGGQPADG